MMTAAMSYVPRGLQLPPVSLGGSPRSTGGFDPVCFHITASTLGSECVRFLFVPLKVESLFPIAFWVSGK